MKLITDPEKLDRDAWRRFILNHASGNIFQSPEMYDVYTNTRHCKPKIVAVVDSKGSIEAMLLAVIQKEYPGLLGVLTARSIIYGGPVIGSDDVEVIELLLEGYNEALQEKCVYTQFRNFTGQSEQQRRVFEEYGYVYEDHLNILVDLSSGAEALWKGVKSNRRSGINKGTRQGFEFKVFDNLANIDEFYRLLGDLYARIKLPFPDISFFQSIEQGLRGNVKWFVLEYEGKPQIILCAPQYKGVLYAYFIGISQDPEFLKLRPVDWFYWEVIKWGSENGVKYFDWMGAGKPDKNYGVRDFKIQYGGEIVNYGRYEKIHWPVGYKIALMGFKMWVMTKQMSEKVSR